MDILKQINPLGLDWNRRGERGYWYDLRDWTGAVAECLVNHYAEPK